MIYLDTHIHIYNCYDIEIFFNSSLANFQKAHRDNSSAKEHQFVLILTDWAKQNWFQELRALTGDNESKVTKPAEWSFRATDEETSLYAYNERLDQGVFIIAGRKIITCENLEVLAIGTYNRFQDQLPIRETIEQITESKGVPVIPWAPGKWTGKRGKKINQLLFAADEKKYFLCDNGNRPTCWPRPSHFKLAEKNGIRILNGSDPLNFSFEVNRAGTYLCLLPGNLSASHPGADIIKILTDPTVNITLYGKKHSLWKFIFKQISMQFLKKKYRKELVG